MRLAKRTSFYRLNRDVLAWVSPTELWHDPKAGLTFVLFSTASCPDEFLAFAVDLIRERVVQSAMLTLTVSGSEWRAENRSPA